MGADRCRVERHALEADFMDSALMYVKFIESALRVAAHRR